MQTTSSSFDRGMERTHVTEYLTDTDQKIPDWLIKIMSLGKVVTTVRSDIKSRFVVIGFSTSDTILGLWFSLSQRAHLIPRNINEKTPTSSHKIMHRKRTGIEKIFSKLSERRGFPGGAVVKNPPANAGGHSFEPWSGKIPHAVEQLSPCAQLLSLRSRAC